jgi:uncharacterized protein YlxW (UPF0749 family)
VAAEPERSRAHAGLVDEVKTGQQRTDDLQARSEELRRDGHRGPAGGLGGSAEELAKVREQQAAAGLAAVTGPGSVVRLADAPAPIDPATGRPSATEVNRVLDIDLQAVVNGLWASGAEAIAVNGQRLTATSTIRVAGNAILVDFRPVTSPYEVSAGRTRGPGAHLPPYLRVGQHGRPGQPVRPGLLDAHRARPHPAGRPRPVLRYARPVGGTK